MRLTERVHSFAHDDRGAMTVDWVVLSAALVSLVLIITNVVGASMEDLSADLRTTFLRDFDASALYFAAQAEEEELSAASGETPTP